MGQFCVWLRVQGLRELVVLLHSLQLLELFFLDKELLSVLHFPYLCLPLQPQPLLFFSLEALSDLSQLVFFGALLQVQPLLVLQLGKLGLPILELSMSLDDLLHQGEIRLGKLYTSS